ncbi:MAG: hypothetical protein CVV11_17200 [Gammaproteobacteria bacterium HGW-Gammaproteobacteria-15]|nr:MAG: hypothetical protein CVV11_17200 [Gammaproteobacteria bacterium HGW-Gammaproteobacteria-15]
MRNKVRAVVLAIILAKAKRTKVADILIKIVINIGWNLRHASDLLQMCAATAKTDTKANLKLNKTLNLVIQNIAERGFFQAQNPFLITA